MSYMDTRCNSKTSISNIDIEESEANAAISDLINNITILTDRKDPLIKSICSPNLLIRSLNELKDLVEMVDIKHSIVNQIKFLITNQARKSADDNNSKFEGHMLHSIISGNPGTGKTTVGMILAKIWMALGCMNKVNTRKESSKIITKNIINTVNNSFRHRVSELEESQRIDRRKLDKLKESLSKSQVQIGEIRRRIIKLKPTTSRLPNPQILELEWEQLLEYTRILRLGFDEIMREINTKNSIIEEIPSQPVDEKDPYENCDPKFIVATREDLVAGFLGHTAIKTRKVLESARGGVLFIDEAYSLCRTDNGSNDKFGEESLDTINEFMSLYPDEIIIIFSGYKDKLLNSIFKVQPGLKRRCTWIFEIKDYSYKGLAKIFSRQLAKNSWSLDPNVNVEEIIADNMDIIQDGGGGTEKLAFFVKIEYGIYKFLKTVQSTPENSVNHDSVITEPMIHSALFQMKHQTINKIINEPPDSMYI